MDQHKNDNLTTNELLIKVLANQHKMMAKQDAILARLNGRGAPDTYARTHRPRIVGRPADYNDDDVIEHFKTTGRVSVTGIQKRFGVGYVKASGIMDRLEARGIVSGPLPGKMGMRELII